MYKDQQGKKTLNWGRTCIQRNLNTNEVFLDLTFGYKLRPYHTLSTEESNEPLTSLNSPLKKPISGKLIGEQNAKSVELELNWIFFVPKYNNNDFLEEGKKEERSG